MAIWLFRRRSRRKRPHSGSQHGDDGHLPRSQTVPDLTAADSPNRYFSFKKRRTDKTDRPEPNKLQRPQRKYSFESGRQDEIRIGRKRSNRGPKRESAPPAARVAGANPAAASGFNAHAAHIANAQKKESGGMLLGDHVLDRVPTLHASKRDGHHPMSRKLSKRRRNSQDREREAELKALRDFTPVRPATDAWGSGRPMKKDSRRVKSGFSLVRHPWEREKYPSDVSLPESIHSSLSSDSEQISFKVSAFDVLAPKPTLRYAIYPRWGEPGSGGSAPARTGSEKRKFSDRSQIPEATLRAHKRIDSLADDLSASDLRELMERDNRRRERKRERDQQRMEQRLAKAAETQRQATEGGAKAPQNMERGVLGRESPTSDNDATTSAVVTSSKHRSSPPGGSPKSNAKRSADGLDADSAINVDEGDSLPEPVHTFHRVSSIPPTPHAERHEEAVTPVPHVYQTNSSTQAQTHDQNQAPARDARGQSPKFKGFLRTKKHRSKSPLSDLEPSDVSATTRKTSETSSRGPMSWTSIFKWGAKAKRTSGPSSFSNTSRDSMATQPQPAAPMHMTFIPPPPPPAMAINRGSLPKRTRSRFREDLPELPISPPDSRVQSPEQDVVPYIIENEPTSPGKFEHRSAPINIPGARYPTPNSDSMRQTPHSWTQDGMDTSPEPQVSMSLASIDSEGSWLSGRMKSGRLSSQMRKRRDSLPKRPVEPSVESDDATETGDHDRMEEDIADDEFLNRVTRHGSNPSSNAWAARKSTGEARPSSDEDDDARWGAVGGKQPTVVHAHIADRVKSREGLLNMLHDEEVRSEAGELDSPVSASGDDVGGLQRATSVNLGKGHVRHISAGSAKLLELSPRTSLDAKRKSSDKRRSEVFTVAE